MKKILDDFSLADFLAIPVLGALFLLIGSLADEGIGSALYVISPFVGILGSWLGHLVLYAMVALALALVYAVTYRESRLVLKVLSYGCIVLSLGFGLIYGALVLAPDIGYTAGLIIGAIIVFGLSVASFFLLKDAERGKLIKAASLILPLALVLLLLGYFLPLISSRPTPSLSIDNGLAFVPWYLDGRAILADYPEALIQESSSFPSSASISLGLIGLLPLLLGFFKLEGKLSWLKRLSFLFPLVLALIVTILLLLGGRAYLSDIGMGLLISGTFTSLTYVGVSYLTAYKKK